MDIANLWIIGEILLLFLSIAIATCYIYLEADSRMLLGPVRAGFGMIREL